MWRGKIGVFKDCNSNQSLPPTSRVMLHSVTGLRERTIINKINCNINMCKDKCLSRSGCFFFFFFFFFFFCFFFFFFFFSVNTAEPKYS